MYYLVDIRYKNRFASAGAPPPALFYFTLTVAPSTAARSPCPLAVPEIGGRGIIPLQNSTAAPATPGFIVHRTRPPSLPLSGEAYIVSFASRTVFLYIYAKNDAFCRTALNLRPKNSKRSFTLRKRLSTPFWMHFRKSVIFLRQIRFRASRAGLITHNFYVLR